MRGMGTYLGAGICRSNQNHLGDLDFADDIALFEEDEKKL